MTCFEPTPPVETRKTPNPLLEQDKPLIPKIRTVDLTAPQAQEQFAVAQLKQGNLDALAVLVQLYQVEAVQSALLIVGDKGLAEEIVQEAYLQAYRKIEGFDDRRPFAPWFLKIVIHAAIKTALRMQRAQPLEEPQEGSRVAEWLLDTSQEPLEIVEEAEQREAIWRALRQLTPEQRAAVVLRYYLDESESEMIRELGRPLTTIKWWLYAARQRLKRLLRPLYAVDSDSQEAEHE